MLLLQFTDLVTAYA